MTIVRYAGRPLPQGVARRGPAAIQRWSRQQQRLARIGRLARSLDHKPPRASQAALRRLRKRYP